MNAKEIFLSLIRRRKSAYHACFRADGGGMSQAGATVINDIVDFCKPYASTHIHAGANGIDPIAAAIQEGKRLTYLHILKQLNLTDEEVIELTQTLEGLQNE